MSRAAATQLRRRNSCSELALGIWICGCRLYWERGPGICGHLVSSRFMSRAVDKLQRHNSCWKTTGSKFYHKLTSKRIWPFDLYPVDILWLQPRFHPYPLQGAEIIYCQHIWIIVSTSGMKFYVAPCTPGLKNLRRCCSASVASCISSHCWAFSVIWLSRMHIIHINPQEVVDPKAMRSNPQKVTILWGQRGTLIADCVYALHFLFNFLWLGWVRNDLVHRGFLW